MARIVPVRGPAADVWQRVREIRAAGDVPLVGDERWPDAQWTAVRALAREATVPGRAGWASLTSGSGGTPRVVVRTAESWRASFPAVSALLRASAGDSVVLPAPPSSSLTLFSLAHAIDGAGPRPVFGGHTAGAAGAAGAVCFHGTPQGLRRLVESDEPTTVRTALVGGSHLEPDLRDAARARGIRVIGYYGAAELSFVAIDDGTGLRPFPGVEVDLRDGELWVRSPFVALGYLGRPGPLRVEGEWATVGDLAELADGALRIRGRADGAILTASATVIPEEVEAWLRRQAGVRDAVVFGLPAAPVGELVAAMIEPRGAAADVAALRRAAAADLAPANRPRAWFSGELPRTAAGKPARAEVRRGVLAKEVSRLA